jgi:predicted AAA+ superfamily ATPase
MERRIVEKLLLWKNNPRRMPLLLQGARQVGKTHTALTFGKTHFTNTVYFNFEDSGEIQAIFDRDLKPDRIVRELSAKSGQSIFKRDTLIVFDEIQACERALTSLKYFCEDAPEYSIVAAGSLLGVALNREKFSFPVGKVDMLTLYPLDFEEFLWATGHADLCDLIRESFDASKPFSFTKPPWTSINSISWSEACRVPSPALSVPLTRPVSSEGFRPIPDMSRAGRVPALLISLNLGP